MKLYRVKLTPEERAHLLDLLSKGKAAARTLTHARILLKANEGVAGPRLSDEAIAEALDVHRSTVERVRVRCVEEGFDAALVTLACSPAPNGRGRLTFAPVSRQARRTRTAREGAAARYSRRPRPHG